MAIPRHQTKEAIENSRGALQNDRGSPSAIKLVRMTKSFSTVESAIGLPRRISQRCCAKQMAILAVREALKIVVNSIEIAEACDCVR